MRAWRAAGWLVAASALGCAADPAVRSKPSGAPPPLLEGTRSDVVADSTGGSSPAAVEAAAPLGAAEAGPVAVDAVLAYAGGREVLASELLETWLQRDSPALKTTLNLLIGARLAQVEADRLGLAVPPALLAERSAQHRATFEASYLREGESLEQFIRQQLDLDPGRFLERLREDTLRELVTERVVRAHTLAGEHARVRLIVVADEQQLEAAQSALATGEEFAAVAERISLDATAERGGLVPYLARTERAPLARLAFRTPVGAVSEPLALEGATVLLLVEARPEPRLGRWRDVGLAVEESLLDEPVSEEEFLVWQLAMEARHGVDLAPFHAYLNEPRR